MSDYGKRGGTSKNAGKTAITYTGTLPDGTPWKKRVFQDFGPVAEAVGLRITSPGGGISICIRGDGDTIPWEGDFGRMVATKQNAR